MCIPNAPPDVPLFPNLALVRYAMILKTASDINNLQKLRIAPHVIRHSAVSDDKCMNRRTLKEIQKREPHLTVDFIKYRYRMCDEGDFDAIFAPHKVSAPAPKENQKIWRRECANLGPRRSPESIKRRS